MAAAKQICFANQLRRLSESTGSPVSSDVLPPGAQCSIMGCAALFEDFKAMTSSEIHDAAYNAGCLCDERMNLRGRNRLDT